MSHIPESSSPALLTWQLLLVLFTLSSLRAGPMSVYLCLLILCFKQQYLGIIFFWWGGGGRVLFSKQNVVWKTKTLIFSTWEYYCSCRILFVSFWLKSKILWCSSFQGNSSENHSKYVLPYLCPHTVFNLPQLHAHGDIE